MLADLVSANTSSNADDRRKEILLGIFSVTPRNMEHTLYISIHIHVIQGDVPIIDISCQEVYSSQCMLNINI
jgi:hypothetical protein